MPARTTVPQTWSRADDVTAAPAPRAEQRVSRLLPVTWTRTLEEDVR